MAIMATRKIADLTIDEFKSLIRETISEDIGAWKETFEILGDRKLMKKIERADSDWQSGKEDAYLSWEKVKE